MELAPYTGAYLTNPAKRWQALIDSGRRVHYAEDLGMWILTRHSDVKDALQDNDRFSNAQTLMPMYEPCPEALELLLKIDAPPTTAAADPPTHPRTRNALRVIFPHTREKVSRQFGTSVRRRVSELVDPLAARADDQVDLVAELTSVLPLVVITDILGVPEEDLAVIKGWADGQLALVWGQPTAQDQVRLARGLLDFWHYCQNLVIEVHQDGGWRPGGLNGGADDFISRALRFRSGDDGVLTLSEISSLAFNLLVAGHETTAGLLAHSTELALADPDRWAALHYAPTTVGVHVEETLRYRPAIDGWPRHTTRDVEIGDTVIPAGARCLLLIGAANRDPAVFAHADLFAPHRMGNHKHLSFGSGPHYCIGAALAQIEAEYTLARLAHQFPGLSLADGFVAQFVPNAAFRAHRELLVRIPVPA